jgi:cellulose synthase/poly-beta-1,6-N-acetylglucosamine synthase-like glycosyltransferase
MQRLVLREAESSLRLDASVFGLAGKVPVVSAQSLLSRGQRRGLIVLAFLFVVGLAIWTIPTTIAAISVVTAVYAAVVVYRFVLFVKSTRSDAVVEVSDEEALAVADVDLPLYTVLIPAFHEPEVISSLVRRIAELEYPADRLDVRLLVESDDDETIVVLSELEPGVNFEIVPVPVAEPRTKPKALNFGLTLARGQYVTVFDAEDRPDPLQLRRAAVAMDRLGPEVACLQSKLSYYNPRQNIITRWFTIEYAMWFSFFLPGLSSLRAPIPLGGTSNHFRRDALRTMGGWDPYNVTEDADLGIRLFREGYQVAVLESTTDEEANSDFVNWVRQRSRWYKGYLQTLIVHLRAPRDFVKDVGWRGLLHFCLFVGGTPILAFLNPIFWTMTALWFVGRPHFILEIFPAPLYYVSLLCWAFGNFLIYYLTVISCRIGRRSELLFTALVVPVYWVMMSMAAVKAFWQLAGARSFWEKTFHGLDPETVPTVGVTSGHE